MAENPIIDQHVCCIFSTEYFNCDIALNFKIAKSNTRRIHKPLKFVPVNNSSSKVLCDFITSLFFRSYLNAIHTSCPHILRYITAAVVTNKRRQSILKDLIRVIKRVSEHVCVLLGIYIVYMYMCTIFRGGGGGANQYFEK